MNSTPDQDKWLALVLNRTPQGTIPSTDEPKTVAAAPGAPAPPPPPPPPGPNDPPDTPPDEPKTPPKKPRATIVWAAPAAVDHAPGDVALTGAQLNATTIPPGLALVYLPAAGARLGVGIHDLTVSLAPEIPFEADPAHVQLVVRKPRAVITWAKPANAAFTQGGFVPGPAQLNATVAPNGPAITYTQDTPGSLAVGSHRITASLADTEPCSADPVTITLEVTKAPATIDWAQPADIPWLQGGITPGDKQLDATTTPNAIKLTYTPETPFPLAIGPHKITASIAEGEPYEAAPKTVTLTIAKGKATISWPQPVPMTWAPRGVTPGPTQLDATTEPPGLLVTYPDLPQGPLEPNTYPVTATLADPSYEAVPVPRSLVVNKAPHGLAWSRALSVPFTPGGLLMSEKFKGAVTNPNKLDLAFTPPLGTRFNAVGPQPLSVTVTDIAHYDPTPLVGTLNISPGKATIKLTPPTTLKSGPEGTLKFDTAVLNATTEPPGLALDYYPEADELLNIGFNSFTVSLAAFEANFQAEPATISITIESGKVETPALTLPDDPPEVIGSIPRGEYPIGAANVIPHIHFYKSSDYHLKILYGNKIKRLNITKSGTLHAQHLQALEAAADIPAVLAIVQAIVEKYG